MRSRTSSVGSEVPGGQEHRWFPGYTVAGAATLAFIATAPGQTFVVSQLNGPLREAFGISALTLNSSYAIATVLASLPLVLVGSWTDRFGPRKAMAGIAFAFGIGCLFMSAVTGFRGVVIAFFLLRFLGQGALSMVSQHATAMWFHRRLGEIHGIKQVVVFAVWVVFPQIALWLIAAVGWRWTYILFAGAIWLSVIPAALLWVRDRPEDLGLSMDGDPPAEAEGLKRVAEGVAAAGAATPSPSGEVVPPTAWDPAFTLREALRTPAYWVLASVVFISPLIGTAFLFDMQPIVAARGMDAQAAALVVSAWTAGMALMAIPAGRLTDRIQPSVLIPIGVAAIAASSVLLWWAPALWVAAGAMVVFAMGQTLTATSSTATIARWFGRRHHGAIRSSIIRIGVIGTGLGPIFTGLSADRTGGYLGSTLAFTLMCLPIGMAATRLRPPGAGASGAG